MKKTLVALAVLAASGASFAQVTITGNLNMGYRAATFSNNYALVNSTVAAPVAAGDKSGLGIDTSNIYFSANEDLGGGTSVAVKYGIDATNRGGIGGGNTSLDLKSSFGTLGLATLERDTDLSDTTANVAAVYVDTALFHDGTDGFHDQISFTKGFGPVTVSLTHIEADVGLGTGSTGSTGQRQNELKAVYAAGPLTVEGSYGSFDNRSTTAGVYIANSVTQIMDSTMTLAGAYDLGVAKLGAGYQTHKYTAGGSSTDLLVSVSVPLGALTLGALYGTEKIDLNGVVPTAEGTTNGFGLSAGYALSKRTSIYAFHRAVDYTVNDNVKTTRTQVGISHSF